MVSVWATLTDGGRSAGVASGGPWARRVSRRQRARRDIEHAQRASCRALKQKRPISRSTFEVGAPGFEPGTSASRTQRSTGLSHAPTCSPTERSTFRLSSRRVDRTAIDIEHALRASYTLLASSSRQPDSNRRPQPWQGCALPAELCLRFAFNLPRWARDVALPSRSDLEHAPACEQPAGLCLRVLRICLPPSHRSELNRRPLDYESSALPLSYGGPSSGAGGSRTRDLMSAIHALSQLSYGPSASNVVPPGQPLSAPLARKALSYGPSDSRNFLGRG